MQVNERKTVRLDDPPSLSARINFGVGDDEVKADDGRINNVRRALELCFEVRVHGGKQLPRLTPKESPRPMSKLHNRAT